MCGIWASLGLDVAEDAIERAAHRGPDGRGWRSMATAAGPLHLGHRRLTITGSDAGRQPMTRGAAGGWLSYNGEIYHRAALAATLATAGCEVRDAADTELVHGALSTWGIGALERLDGMFALAYFDAAAGRLLVARDRFGIKPLYLCRVGTGIAFASEIKQFLAIPGFRARLHAASARDFLDLGLTDHTTATLWQGVTSVLPATALIVDIEASGAFRISERRWYRLPEPASSAASSGAAVQRLAAVLRTAVNAHVPDAVPTGISLSGGLDSSAIACLTQEPLPCFSLVHDEPEVDESRYARSVADHRGAPLTAVRLHAEELQHAVASTVRHLDEPFPSLSVVAQWAVFREARRHGMKVLLTGQGADELLGGYPFLLGPQLAGLLRSWRFGRMFAEIAAQRRVHERAAGASLRALLTAMAPSALLSPLLRRGWSEPQLARARLAVARGGRRDRAAFGIGAFRHDLLGAANLAMLLRYEDRTAMAHGIEARPPFLDRQVVEAALELDGHELVVAGITKQPLRAATQGLLPGLVLQRTDKRGFPTPEAAWLKGPLSGYALHSARAAHERFPELVSAAALDAVRTVLAEPGPLRAPIWRIAALGAWAQEFSIEP